MKISCPVCQSQYSLRDAATTTALKEMVGLASRFGSAWGLAEEYVDSFRTSRYGSVGMKKKIRLLQETVKLWEGCEFEFDGKRYRTDHRQIRDALYAICNKEMIGFKNHNYLKSVLCGKAQRVSGQGMTAKEEEQREESRRSEAEGRRLKAEGEDTEGRISAAEYMKKKGLKSLTDKIGVEL